MTTTEQIQIEARDGIVLDAGLQRPDGAIGTVVFAHGSGSSRHSPRNQAVAALLNAAGLETVLLDLLTRGEDEVDRVTREHRFDIPLLAQRVVAAVDWAKGRDPASPVGLFGASTGAAAALKAAAERPEDVAAVVSRGGRVDLAGDSLPVVTAPTLLIVGGDDRVVLDLNRRAAREMPGAEVRIEVVPGASHLFEEPGTLERVALLASDWFQRLLDGAQ